MTENKKYGWGGRRPNQTGRPVGTTKPEGVRSQHQIRAYDDEWELIREFARLVKHVDKEKCKTVLAQLEAQNK